jgi:tRNA pseudouridine32 synthase/23S rRNA pseudouridine746 synthase/23S rRNA pseudouridine1911/1915/1917 synthase
MVRRMKKNSRSSSRHRRLGLNIIFEDRDIVVIEKEPGLLTWSPHRDQPKTAERILTSYLRKGNARSSARAYTVHRLDRDTSGLLVFAKSERVQQRLKNNWNDTEKHYFVVAHGSFEQPKGAMICYLAEDKDQYVYVTKKNGEGKRAESRYTVTNNVGGYSAVDVMLVTGRKNQIRVQLADAGHPIVGDKKYGKKGDRVSRMALHAMSLAFDHPFSGRRMIFESPVPESLSRLVQDGRSAVQAGVELKTKEAFKGREKHSGAPGGPRGRRR